MTTDQTTETTVGALDTAIDKSIAAIDRALAKLAKARKRMEFDVTAG